MRDLLPPEASRRRRLARKLLDHIALHGYELVTPPAFELADVLERGLGALDPRDVLGAIRLSKATVRKMKQNLFWAAIYNVIAIPVAAGVLYPAFGLLLRPEFGALATNKHRSFRVTKDIAGGDYKKFLRAAALRFPLFMLVWREQFSFEQSARAIRRDLKPFELRHRRSSRWPGT